MEITIGEWIQLLCVPVFILGIWVLGIYKAFKFPDGPKILKPILLKMLMAGGLISLLLGAYFDSNTPGDYGDLGFMLGGVLGFGGTFTITGFVLLVKISKAFDLYKQSAAYKAETIDSNVLDDL